MLPTPPNQVYYRGPFTLYSSAETCGLPTHHPLPHLHSAPPRDDRLFSRSLFGPDDCSFTLPRVVAPTVDTVRVSLLGATKDTLAVSVAKRVLSFYHLLCRSLISNHFILQRGVVECLSSARARGGPALGLGGASRLTGVLVLQRAEFRDLLWDVWTTLLRSRQLYLDSLFWSKWST